jgi:hypothetical protein
MQTQLKIFIELTIDDPTIRDVGLIKECIEAALANSPALARAAWSCGTFVDSEMVKIVVTETHDTKQS